MYGFDEAFPYFANEIIHFKPLAYYVAEQIVPYGTELWELNLPPVIMATVQSMPTAATPTDIATPTDAPKVTSMYIPVTWEAHPEFDGNTPGLYVFTALVGDGFVFEVEPPVIFVAVETGRTAPSIPFTATPIDEFLTAEPTQQFTTTPMIAADEAHTVALRNDGTVWTWGWNSSGQLGDGTTTDRHTPVQVQNLDNVTTIAAGGANTVALRNDGTVWAWGNNWSGQLGDGTRTDRHTPVQVQNLDNVTAIAAGLSHAVALRNDGTVWAWGGNGSGQLGDGTTVYRYIPVQVQGLDNVTAIAAGLSHIVALRNDGTVWAWGYNRNGRLGDGTTTNRHAPVQVQSYDSVTAIAAGEVHTVALRNDGRVWAWGHNYFGNLGDGTTADRLTPVQTQSLNNATAIAAGAIHTVALRNDGRVWAWGSNEYGELGDGTTTNRRTPVQVQGIDNVTAIAGGGGHTVALRNDGTVWAWGWNNNGQLGDGTTTNRHTPVQVHGLYNATAISAGFTHTVALRNDGTVWAWGRNNNGQLGDGTATTRLTPVQVQGLDNVTAIAAGNSHTVALRNDGSVWAWGWNVRGQLGDGTTTQRRTPVQVQGLYNVEAIAAGGVHTVALRNNGTVWAWGFNERGSLGDGTRTRRLTPVQVQGLDNVTAIAAGSCIVFGSQTVALRNDGTVWAWGTNELGELGDGTTTDRLTPVQTLLSAGHFNIGPTSRVAVTVNNPAQGTARANSAHAAPGTTVHLSAHANVGYAFDRWEVVSGGVTLDINDPNTSFTMPSENVSVMARFAAEPGQEPAYLTITTTQATPGCIAIVQLRLDNNPGFASMMMRLSFSDYLTLTGHSLGNPDMTDEEREDLGRGFVYTRISNVDTFMGWTNRGSDFSACGVLLNLTFAVSPNAQEGDFLPVEVFFENDIDGAEEPTNLAGDTLNIEITNGGVEVIGATLTVSTTYAGRHGRATLQLQIDDNPGFADMPMRLSFADGLTLIGYELGRQNLTPEQLEDLQYGFIAPTLGSADTFMGWADRQTDIDMSGVLLGLTFGVCQGAVAYDFLPVEVFFENDIGVELPANAAGDTLNIEIINGGVEVQSFLIGDANNDGRRTSADGTRLARHLANHGVTIELRGMDLNLDGYVDGADLILFAQWLVGHGAPPAVGQAAR